MVAGRRAVLVQDEFELTGNCEVAWGMTTDARIRIAGPKATLVKEGKELQAEILSPAGAELTVESAERKPPEYQNRGVRRLIVRLGGQSRKVRVAVLLSPVWPDGQAVDLPIVKPLEEW